MDCYAIITRNGSSLAPRKVFGHFTTKELAEKAYALLPDNIRAETKIKRYPEMNILTIKEEKIDVTETIPENVLASRDEDGYVEGYARVDINEIGEGDFETFMDILSEQVVGNCSLTDISYEAVDIVDHNTILFKVSGCVDDTDIEDYFEDNEESESDN